MEEFVIEHYSPNPRLLIEVEWISDDTIDLVLV